MVTRRSYGARNFGNLSDTMNARSVTVSGLDAGHLAIVFYECGIFKQVTFAAADQRFDGAIRQWIEYSSVERAEIEPTCKCESCSKEILLSTFPIVSANGTGLSVCRECAEVLVGERGWKRL